MADVIPLVPQTSIVLPPADEPIEETLARWEAALPLHHGNIERTIADAIQYIHGRRDLNFLVAAEQHAIEGMVVLYDLVADHHYRKVMRKEFRKMMKRHRGRLAPYYPELHTPLRTRLREHKMFVLCGLDAPDPDERRKGKRDA
jgi:hypothetical protein